MRLIHIVQLMTPEYSELLKWNNGGNGDYLFFSILSISTFAKCEI